MQEEARRTNKIGFLRESGGLAGGGRGSDGLNLLEGDDDPADEVGQHSRKDAAKYSHQNPHNPHKRSIPPKVFREAAADAGDGFVLARAAQRRALHRRRGERLLGRAAVVAVARTVNNFFLAVVASHLASPCSYLRRLELKSSLPLGTL